MRAGPAPLLGPAPLSPGGRVSLPSRCGAGPGRAGWGSSGHGAQRGPAWRPPVCACAAAGGRALGLHAARRAGARRASHRLQGRRRRARPAWAPPHLPARGLCPVAGRRRGTRTLGERRRRERGRLLRRDGAEPWPSPHPRPPRPTTPNRGAEWERGPWGPRGRRDSPGSAAGRNSSGTSVGLAAGEGAASLLAFPPSSPAGHSPRRVKALFSASCARPWLPPGLRSVGTLGATVEGTGVRPVPRGWCWGFGVGWGGRRARNPCPSRSRARGGCGRTATTSRSAVGTDRRPGKPARSRAAAEDAAALRVPAEPGRASVTGRIGCLPAQCHRPAGAGKLAGRAVSRPRAASLPQAGLAAPRGLHALRRGAGSVVWLGELEKWL